MDVQPIEMYYLSIIEMCQRFALWGIGNLLVIYTITYFGYSDLDATQLYGVFTGLAFALPIVGGYIADRTNYKIALMIGSLATALGCFMLAAGIWSLLHIALFMVALGTSIFTPSIYALLGILYKKREHLREGGFSIYYALVNIGVFLGTIILGSLGQANKWGLAFSIAGFIQLLSLLVFFKLMRSPGFSSIHVMQDKLSIYGDNGELKNAEKERIIVICTLSFVSILFSIAYSQGWSSMSIFALDFTNKTLGSLQVPASWLLSIESLYIVILAFPLVRFYQFLVSRKLDPTPSLKIVFGLLSTGLCFYIMMLGSIQIPEGAQHATVNPMYPIAAYALIAIGEMLIMPIGLSLITRLSPRLYTAFFVGLWYLCSGIANYFGGVIGGYMTSSAHIWEFFEIFVFITWIPAFVLFLLVKKLGHMSHFKDFE